MNLVQGRRDTAAPVRDAGQQGALQRVRQLTNRAHGPQRPGADHRRLWRLRAGVRRAALCHGAHRGALLEGFWVLRSFVEAKKHLVRRCSHRLAAAGATACTWPLPPKMLGSIVAATINLFTVAPIGVCHLSVLRPPPFAGFVPSLFYCCQVGARCRTSSMRS